MASERVEFAKAQLKLAEAGEVYEKARKVWEESRKTTGKDWENYRKAKAALDKARTHARMLRDHKEEGDG